MEEGLNVHGGIQQGGQGFCRPLIQNQGHIVAVMFQGEGPGDPARIKIPGKLVFMFKPAEDEWRRARDRRDFKQYGEAVALSGGPIEHQITVLTDRSNQGIAGYCPHRLIPLSAIKMDMADVFSFATACSAAVLVFGSGRIILAAG
jgi:hypothetical protein